MKEKREIRNRWNGTIMHSGETNTLVELVVANKANLREANLRGANLIGRCHGTKLNLTVDTP